MRACHPALPVAWLVCACAAKAHASLSVLPAAHSPWRVPHCCPQEGAERYNLGLLVKEAAKGLCVPGYVHPTQDGNGWMYSTAMVQVRLRHARGEVGCAEARACTDMHVHGYA